DLVGSGAAKRGPGRLVAMANLYTHPHLSRKSGDGNPVHIPRPYYTRCGCGSCADGDAMARRIDLKNVERVGRGNAEALALANGEVVDAGVAPDDYAGSGDQLARRVWNRLALLVEI